MHRDELAIAYNANSILQTGYDEWGEHLPFVFKSFGDYKLPGLIYSTVIGIKLFGLNQFGARIVSALLASLVIPLSFIFTKKLYKSNFISFFAPLFISFSFWHISGSRNVYEPIVALSIALLSYYFLYKSAFNKNHLFLSILFYSISIWFYHTPLFIFPILFIAWYVKKQKKINNKKWWIIAFLVLSFSTLINFLLITKLNNSRSQTTIFKSQELIDSQTTQLHKFWSSGIPLHPLFIYSQKAYQVGYYFIQGYVKAISPDFIFITGGNNYWHNLRTIGFGNENPALFILVIFGLIYLIKNSTKDENFFILVLLLLSPIPNALTIDSPNINRLLDFHYLLTIIGAIGLYSVYKGFNHIPKLKINRDKILFIVILISYAVFMVQFLISYFLIFNKSLHQTWNDGYPELVTKIKESQENYDKVFIKTNVPESYIFYLFYLNYSPDQLLKNNNQGITHTEQIDHVYFNSFEHPLSEKILVITPAGAKTTNSTFEITNWEDKILWEGSVYSHEENQ